MAAIKALNSKSSSSSMLSSSPEITLPISSSPRRTGSSPPTSLPSTPCSYKQKLKINVNSDYTGSSTTSSGSSRSSRFSVLSTPTKIRFSGQPAFYFKEHAHYKTPDSSPFEHEVNEFRKRRHGNKNKMAPDWTVQMVAYEGRGKTIDFKNTDMAKVDAEDVELEKAYMIRTADWETAYYEKDDGDVEDSSLFADADFEEAEFMKAAFENTVFENVDYKLYGPNVETFTFPRIEIKTLHDKGTGYDTFTFKDVQIKETQSESFRLVQTRIKETDFQDTSYKVPTRQNTDIQNTSLLNSGLKDAVQITNASFQGIRFTDNKNTGFAGTSFEKPIRQNTGAMDVHVRNTNINSQSFDFNDALKNNTGVDDTSSTISARQNTDVININLKDTGLKGTKFDIPPHQNTGVKHPGPKVSSYKDPNYWKPSDNIWGSDASINDNDIKQHMDLLIPSRYSTNNSHQTKRKSSESDTNSNNSKRSKFANFFNDLEKRGYNHSSPDTFSPHLSSYPAVEQSHQPASVSINFGPTDIPQPPIPLQQPHVAFPMGYTGTLLSTAASLHRGSTRVRETTLSRIAKANIKNKVHASLSDAFLGVHNTTATTNNNNNRDCAQPKSLRLVPTLPEVLHSLDPHAILRYINHLITASNTAASDTMQANAAFYAIPSSSSYYAQAPGYGCGDDRGQGFMTRVFASAYKRAMAGWREVREGVEGLRKVREALDTRMKFRMIEARAIGSGMQYVREETLLGRPMRKEVMRFVEVLEEKVEAYEAVMDMWRW